MVHVLNRLYVNNNGPHHILSGVLLGVQYLASNPHNPVIFFLFLFSCYKGVYKCKLVNSISVDPNAFIHSAQIFFTLPGIYTDDFEKPWLLTNQLK